MSEGEVGCGGLELVEVWERSGQIYMTVGEWPGSGGLRVVKRLGEAVRGHLVQVVGVGCEVSRYPERYLGEIA